MYLYIPMDTHIFIRLPVLTVEHGLSNYINPYKLYFMYAFRA